MSWFFTSTFVLSCLWWIGSTASVDNGFYEFSSSLHQVAKDRKIIDPHRPAYLKLSHRRSYPLERCDPPCRQLFCIIGKYSAYFFWMLFVSDFPFGCD